MILTVITDYLLIDPIICFEFDMVVTSEAVFKANFLMTSLILPQIGSVDQAD